MPLFHHLHLRPVFNAWFRRAMGYNSYDVSYSFYTNRETGYKYFSGGSICFGTNPR